MFFKFRILTAFCFLFIFSSCATSAMKDATSGATGCLPDEIEIMDGGSPRNWKAKCDGKIYVCSGMGGSVNCTERVKKDEKK